MCQQTGTQQVKQNTMEQTILQTTQQEHAFQAVQLQPKAMQEQRIGAQMAQLIQNQAEMAQADVQQALGEMPQQQMQEAAAISKSEEKALKRRRKRLERHRKRQLHKAQKEQEREWKREQKALAQQQKQQPQQQQLQEQPQEQQQKDPQLLAREITENNSVVKGLSHESWEKNGGASFHYTVTEQEAEKIVAASDDCIYAKPVGAGLVELRPTLPETVKIGGREVPFCKSYNLMMKVIARNILDKDGRVQKNAEDFTNTLSLIAYQNEKEKAADMKRMLRELFYPSIKKLCPGKKAAEEAYQNVEAVFMGMEYRRDYGTTSMLHSSGFSREAISGLQGLAENLTKMDAGRFQENREELRKKLQEQVDRGELQPEELRLRLAEQCIKELPKRKADMQRVMQEEGYSEEEQRQLLKGVTSMYADLDAAKVEFIRLRDLDIDSREVYLPNRCSANAHLYAALHRLRTGEVQDHIAYSGYLHVAQNKMRYLNYALEHYEFQPGEREMLEEFRQKLENGEELARNEVRTIDMICGREAKYAYHAGANIGQVDDMQITIETFAAETTQFTVSPFTAGGAIGLYRGRARTGSDEMRSKTVSDGMIAYYLQDDPLPAVETRILAKTNAAMKNHLLPGDEQYVSRKQTAQQKGEGNA